jgi:dipeptidase E
MMQQIIAFGGGGFSMEPENPAIDQYIVRQTGKPHPRVCFLPTASGDPEPYILHFYQAFLKLDCRPSVFSVFRPPTADLAGFLLEKDVLYVGGGSTRAMLALWREFGLPEILQQALQEGIILTGLSAGANCWFEACSTDSLPGKPQVLSCLGFLRGSFCPHYDSESERRPSYHEMIRSGQLMNGYATDDGAALHFINGELHTVVTSRPQAYAYRVDRKDDGVQEASISAQLLPSVGC